MRRLKPGELCQHCDEIATSIVWRDPSPHNRYKGSTEALCAVHAKQVLNENNPEYRVSCPNCHCEFGVN